MLYALPAQAAQSKPERFAGIAVVAGVHLAVLIAVIIGIGPRIPLPRFEPPVTVYQPEPTVKPLPRPPVPFKQNFVDPTVPKLPEVVIPITSNAPIARAPAEPLTPTGPSTGDTNTIRNTTATPTPVGIACPNSQAIRESVPYPRMAIREGIQGDVLVRFVVGTSGQIRDIVIAESSHRVFNSAAIAAVREFRCMGQASDVQVEVPFSFRLNN